MSDKLYFAEGIVSRRQESRSESRSECKLDALVENGESLLFPGESIEVTKRPIDLPDSNAALKALFMYKVKRKKEESDDEEEKKPEESSSESELEEEEEESEPEEQIDDGDESS